MIYARFTAVLCCFARDLCRIAEIALNHAKIAVKPDGFGWIYAENRRKIWIFPGAFVRRCAKMVESFEAGNTKVFKVFPTNFNSGGTVSN